MRSLNLNFKLYTFILVILGGLVACKKDDNKVVLPLEAITFKNLDASAATNKFTFFNLKTGLVVANSDSASTKWDIGFRKTAIIFNGGTSGPGQAGAILQDGIFSQIIEAPASGYVSDNAPTYALTPQSGQGWYDYNGATNIISPRSGKVILVKTVDGKYAKVEVLSYYKDAPASPDAATSVSRFYTFRYVYQADGSLKLN